MSCINRTHTRARHLPRAFASQIRHRAARHQWSVSNALSWFPVLGSWDYSFWGGQTRLLHDPLSSCVNFLQVCFCCVFCIHSKKASRNGIQIGTKSMKQMCRQPFRKKCPKMNLESRFCLLFFKRPMCFKQGKYCVRMTFSLFADNLEPYENNF